MNESEGWKRKRARHRVVVVVMVVVEAGEMGGLKRLVSSPSL